MIHRYNANVARCLRTYKLQNQRAYFYIGVLVAEIEEHPLQLMLQLQDKKLFKQLKTPFLHFLLENKTMTVKKS